jgi:pimeloyl-ACP methyl ester carboxylesterase
MTQPPLSRLCPPQRGDALCTALRQGAQEPPGPAAAAAHRRAGALVAAAVRSDPAGALADPAVRHYLRERWVALFLWNVVTARGRELPEIPYAEAALAAADRFFPPHRAEPGRFLMARTELPPQLAPVCDTPDLLVFVPQLARLPGRDEFARQAREIRAQFPCTHFARAETDSLVAPEVAAARVRATIEEALVATGPSTRLHLVGHSYGVRIALEVLLAAPALAARTRSLVALHSAARGSELADLVHAALTAPQELCVLSPPLCRWAGERSLEPVRQVIERLGPRVLGVEPQQLVDVLRAELGQGQTAGEYLAMHLPCARALTTWSAEEFWRLRGTTLPPHVVYASFRTAITEPFGPALRKLAWDLLPYLVLSAYGPNDVLVTLERQRLGLERELVSPVTEGNHMQWIIDGSNHLLVDRDVVAATPQSELALAYYQLFHEIGLFGSR